MHGFGVLCVVVKCGRLVGFVTFFIGAVAIVGKTRREIVEDMHDASTEGIGICPNCGTPCEPEDMFCDDGAEEDVSES